MATEIENQIRLMKAKIMTEKDLTKIMDKLKYNNATGPNGMRGEYLIVCFNSVLEEEETPDSWTVSRTMMIGKTKNPTVKGFQACGNNKYCPTKPI